MNALKNQYHDSPETLKIDIIDRNQSCLRSVRADDHDAELMAKWRVMAWKKFFTQIQPTCGEVLEWLESYATNVRDIIFFVESPLGCPVGQLSLYNIDSERELAEFGRLIRGEPIGPKGLMTTACFTLLQWGFESLNIGRVKLDVFSDNEKAIILYERLGFRASYRKMYRKMITPNNIVQWVKTENTNSVSIESRRGCREVIRMILDRDDLRFPTATPAMLSK